MIPSRVHAAIDYGVAGALGALALLPGLTGRTRGALGGAALYHTSYSALTDYEGGVSGQIGMGQHLALDGLGAAALCGTGLLVGRRNRAEGGLLLAIGLAELAVIALSDRTAAAGPPSMDLPAAGCAQAGGRRYLDRGQHYRARMRRSG